MREVGEELGQPVGGEVLRDAEPQHAFAARLGDDFAGFLFEREYAPRVGEQSLALFGRRDLLAIPVQQRIAERFLEPPDLLAYR